MIFPPKPISETKRLLDCTEREAQITLEATARRLLKTARWYPYHTRIRELQKPLLQLKLARRNHKKPS